MTTEEAVEKTTSSNGDAIKDVKVDEGQLKKDIVRQIEHYFGDFNLMRDAFLKKAIVEAGEEGWVGLDVMLKFNRLSRLSTDPALILGAVKGSGSKLVEADEEKRNLRRLPSVGPLPEFNEEVKKDLVLRTVYCKGFDKVKMTSLDDLIRFFDRFPDVVHVNRRTYQDRKDGQRHFKGSVFVTFKDRESAKKFLDIESVKSSGGGEELIRMWQADYFKAKDQEAEDRTKSKQEQKKQNKKAQKVASGQKDDQGQADEAEKSKVKDDDDDDDGEVKVKDEKVDEEEDDLLPTGSVLVLENITDPTTIREDIKAQLKDQFDVDPKSIAFIFFQKGDTSAKLRFNLQNAAKDLEEKMKAAELEGQKKFQVKASEDVKFSVMQGDEEKTFLDQCKKDIQGRKVNQGGQKRKANFGGGRGGGGRGYGGGGRGGGGRGGYGGKRHRRN